MKHFCVILRFGENRCTGAATWVVDEMISRGMNAHKLRSKVLLPDQVMNMLGKMLARIYPLSERWL